MKIAVIGMGYVGLPLAKVFAEAGVEVVGIEALPERCAQINAGRSYIDDVPSADLARLVARVSCGRRRTTQPPRTARPASSACRRR